MDKIRDAEAADAQSVCAIYNHYVGESVATFEVEPVELDVMRQRIVQTSQNYPWLVLERGDRIVGYAYATQWKPRSAYAKTAESTVYVGPDAGRSGVGLALMTALLERLQAMDLHAVLAGIALPNPASVALHERLGFKQVAHFQQTGRKFQRWIDVGYWERLMD